MSSHKEYYPQFWPEKCEQDPKMGILVPPWHILEAQNAAIRAALVKEEEDGKHIIGIGEGNPHRRKYGTVPESIRPSKFNLHNIHCFNGLPAIAHQRDSIANAVVRSVAGRVAPWDLDQVRSQTEHEVANTFYHHAMWRRYGRRVYVLDETTYTLLAETPLPDLPASILAMPEHSFYLALPKRAGLKFGVWNMWDNKEDQQEIEGIMVAMDNIDPDSPEVRELAFLNVGSSESGSTEDRNIAFISISLGPDALLSEVRFNDTPQPGQAEYGPRNDGFASPVRTGAYELGVITPRVILGFLLYLQSEHPDLEPVSPPPRRSFHDIRSPQQKAAALANQAEKLRGTSRLPILYVGRHLAEEIAEQRRAFAHDQLQGARSGTNRTLDHPVWVRGHWKRQPYGEGRLLRRMIWIKPYLKGPDTAEVLKAKAAKVQKAQHAESKPEVEVTPLPVPRIDRMKHA